MARNQEKAMSTLSRWREAQRIELNGPDKQRPFSAGDCDNVPECERWRNQIIGEISKKVATIQNSALGEYKIRDLNDDINKSIREKRHWEYRIRELGGPDYFKIGSRMLDKEGKEVPGNKGYRYFGAARDLPGIRELFEPEPPKEVRRTRAQLMKLVNADYYGYRDDDDEVLKPLETEAEKYSIQKAIDDWKEAKENGFLEDSDDEEEDIYKSTSLFDKEIDFGDGDVAKTDEKMEIDGEEKEEFVAHVPVPSQEDVEKYLIQRQKKALMDRYVSESLQAQVANTEKMALT